MIDTTTTTIKFMIADVCGGYHAAAWFKEVIDRDEHGVFKVKTLKLELIEEGRDDVQLIRLDIQRGKLEIQVDGSPILLDYGHNQEMAKSHFLEMAKSHLRAWGAPGTLHASAWVEYDPSDF